MEFLYPTEKKFPFDDACAEIVRALEARNFEVPGVEVELRTYGSGEQKMRYVRLVRGLDCQIEFGRAQRTLPGGMYDVAAASSIAIPGKKLNVYGDDSGPTFWLYVGGDRESDRERFMSGPGVNSRRNGRPRAYLRYTGERAPGAWPDRRARTLHVDYDVGREYDAEKGDPRVLQTAVVMAELAAHLRDIVLSAICAHPPAGVRTDPLAEPTPVPFPAGIGPIFCFGGYRDARRIQRGRADPSQLTAADRFGMPPEGWRLAPTTTPNDGTLPEVAYDGFLWCGLGEVAARVPEGQLTGLEQNPRRVGPGEFEVPFPKRNLRIPGSIGGLHNNFVIRVTPRSANEIYVADHAAYDRRRKEIAGEIVAAREDATKSRTTYNHTEIDDFIRARARTIVPIAEYRGDFGDPVILIRRELALDEVEVVGDEHKD